MAGARAMRIAERSGVSWGGIQHQFGTKAAILDAVLEQVLLDFKDTARRFSTRATSLQGRVEALIDASWDLMLDPTYQAFREVMRDGARGSESGMDPGRILERVEATLRPLRIDLFPELRGAPMTLDLLNAILFSTLSGMAEQQRYEAFPSDLTRRQLKALRGTLLDVVRRRSG